MGTLTTTIAWDFWTYLDCTHHKKQKVSFCYTIEMGQSIIPPSFFRLHSYHLDITYHHSGVYPQHQPTQVVSDKAQWLQLLLTFPSHCESAIKSFSEMLANTLCADNYYGLPPHFERVFDRHAFKKHWLSGRVGVGPMIGNLALMWSINAWVLYCLNWLK